MITWEEFIPVGIEAIKTFYARNMTLQNSKEAAKDLDKEAMESVYYPEIKKAWEILEKEFKKQDIKENGTITTYQLKQVLKKTTLVTPKEVNALVRNCPVDEYEYQKFKEDLFNVRFELAKSRILESNMDHVQKSLVEECKKFDKNSNNKIHITQMREVLKESKFIALSPFQIHVLLGQAEIDEDRFLNYQKFSFKVREMIDNIFSVEALSKSADLIKQETVKMDDIERSYISNLDLFQIFKKYDRNKNGYLDLDEYMQCLKSQELDLKNEEIVALSMVADTNGDGQIDYEEFMKHFREVLEMVRFQKILHKQSTEFMEAKRQQAIARAKEEEAKRAEDD